MKISPKEFRQRYNIATSTEAKLRADGVVPFEKVGRFVIYDRDITDDLAKKGRLGRNALIAIHNILEADASEEHY